MSVLAACGNEADDSPPIDLAGSTLLQRICSEDGASSCRFEGDAKIVESGLTADGEGIVLGPEVGAFEFTLDDPTVNEDGAFTSVELFMALESDGDDDTEMADLVELDVIDTSCPDCAGLQQAMQVTEQYTWQSFPSFGGSLDNAVFRVANGRGGVVQIVALRTNQGYYDGYNGCSVSGGVGRPARAVQRNRLAR